MKIEITTPISDADRALILALLGEADTGSAEKTPTPAEKPTSARKAGPAKKVTPAKPEPVKEEPEPMAEEPVAEEPDDEAGDEEQSDEDLLALAVKKATEMVAGGDATKVREALDAAGAARVRELNKDNVRDFFQALS